MGFLGRLFGRREAELTDALEKELSWLIPPQDMHDEAAWDVYWNNHITHGVGAGMFDMLHDDDAVIECLSANRLSTVLCVGSGLSREPSLLAKAGFDVTAMDLSPLAMRIASAIALEQGHAVRFIAGDLMDKTVCPGPFDVIIERRTIQLFPDEERPLALAALVDRLAPRALLLSHCHDGSWRPPAEPRHATEGWFRDNGWPIWHRAQQLQQRAAWLVMSTG